MNIYMEVKIVINLLEGLNNLDPGVYVVAKIQFSGKQMIISNPVCAVETMDGSHNWVITINEFPFEDEGNMFTPFGKTIWIDLLKEFSNFRVKKEWVLGTYTEDYTFPLENLEIEKKPDLFDTDIYSVSLLSDDSMFDNILEERGKFMPDRIFQWRDGIINAILNFPEGLEYYESDEEFEEEYIEKEKPILKKVRVVNYLFF